MPEYEVVSGTVEKDGTQYGPDHDQKIIVLGEHRANFLGDVVQYHGEADNDNDSDDERGVGGPPMDPVSHPEDVGTDASAPEDTSEVELDGGFMDDSLDALSDELESGAWDDRIADLHEYEEENQDRKGAYDLLQERRSTVAEAAQTADEPDDGGE